MENQNHKRDGFDWVWDTSSHEVCKILVDATLWGNSAVQVWYPATNEVKRVSYSQLCEINSASIDSVAHAQYVACATKIVDSVAQHQLLAPINSSVIPLPHQLSVLSRAVTDGRYRLLLADEVGLGKTIEAGLIMRELKLRGLVKRVLVVAPKGLVSQWMAEMKTRFNEDFTLIYPNEASHRLQTSADSIWNQHSSVVCSMDSVKPIESRRGRTIAETNEYNRIRFHDLISANWDLIIIDEAHRLGGSNDVIARYRLGKALAKAAPFFLLLSATPHQGKTDAFHRLMQLLDEENFPNIESISRSRIAPYVFRSEKRFAIDSDGNPLFKPREAKLCTIRWESRHDVQRTLYEIVSNYVREGYNQAIREQKTYKAFLMLLMQRLVTSSTNAIVATLRKRKELLSDPTLHLETDEVKTPDDWNDLDGQTQLESLEGKFLEDIAKEGHQIDQLLAVAERALQQGNDTKAESLLSLIYRLQQEENDPHVKLLVFTEFIPTQAMLQQFLQDRGFDVVCLNGSLDLPERLDIQKRFEESSQVLISTDAGGEGINLQFCHLVVNYDLPWNPMRIEQRIGRVDRIGQTKVVRAFNLIVEDTVEYRVREVLEEKLKVILDDLGIDKTSDVLDSSLSGSIFDVLYMNALADPSSIEAEVQLVTETVKSEGKVSFSVQDLFNETHTNDATEAQALRSHPLPHWIERMVASYEAYKGKLSSLSGSEQLSIDYHFRYNLGDPRIKIMLETIPPFVEGQFCGEISLRGFDQDIEGVFSLWEIAVTSSRFVKKRYLPLFHHNDGRWLPATSRAVWDALLSVDKEPLLNGHSNIPKAEWNQHLGEAEKNGKQFYLHLQSELNSFLERENARREYHLRAKEVAAEQLGLDSVKTHRLQDIAREREFWKTGLIDAKQYFPILRPVLFLRIVGGGSH